MNNTWSQDIRIWYRIGTKLGIHALHRPDLIYSPAYIYSTSFNDSLGVVTKHGQQECRYEY